MGATIRAKNKRFGFVVPTPARLAPPRSAAAPRHDGHDGHDDIEQLSCDI